MHDKCRSYNKKRFNIPSCQFCIIACANYNIISSKRNIMGRLVPSHTCLRVAKLNTGTSLYNGSRVRDSEVVYFPVPVYGFFVTASAFCLRCFSESGSSSGSTPSVHPSVCPYVRNTLWYQVCVICNSKYFHFFLFKLCQMIFHILKMCTSHFVQTK